MIRVLYAEDDPQLPQMVRLYLAHASSEFHVETVVTARACLARMQQGGVDLLLLDMVLPDSDGLHILAELAARRDPTPVLMVSSQGQNELAVRALRAGAVDCIDKASPQFLQLPEIIERIYAQHVAARRSAAPFASVAPGPSAGLTAPPADAPPRVLLLETNPLVRDSLRAFLGESARPLTLVELGSLAEMERTITTGPAPALAILGPSPGADNPVDVLRRLRFHARDLRSIVVSTRTDADTAVAAFKLGAADYLAYRDGYLLELVFSLNNLLNAHHTERENLRLTRELENLNRSLEAQVTARTAELEQQIAVRRAAESRAEGYAARLQELSQRLIRIQEDERRALARELHDQVGQMLTGLKFQLEKSTAAAAPELRPALTEALHLADDLLSRVRQMTQQFRPRILDDLGLRPALEWHVGLFEKQTSIAVDLEISLPADRLAGELETAIFRVVQESLTNVARHSGTAHASVTVTRDDDHVLVEITDRGCGFDVDHALASRDSVGLTGIAERVSLAGGSLEIFSRPGVGTRVNASFPLGPAAAPSAP
ncbi:response regulator [Horticoccus luteus]|uniref:histidine kinase n=1 Tax=Horticoccus luteus TaxID=2862869 RepID=A0A8F9XLG0_9BACT|nr:response regulator [Horticoccus luteus]QYM79181.1 response regulator [Horticoccus luteus]